MDITTTALFLANAFRPAGEYFTHNKLPVVKKLIGAGKIRMTASAAAGGELLGLDSAAIVNIAATLAPQDVYTLPRHNLPIYPSPRGRVAALQIACVVVPHGAICALHRIPRGAAKSVNCGEVRYTKA